MNDQINKITSMLEDAKDLSLYNPQDALKICKEALRISKRNNLKKEEGKCLLGMSYSYRVVSNYVEGLKCSFNALEIFQEINNLEGIARAYNIIGIIYFYHGSYGQALEYMLKALEILESTPDHDYLISCVYNNIGEIFREAKDYNNALENYTKALDISRNNAFKNNEAAILLNIGKTHSSKEKYSASLDFLYKSNVILQDTKDVIAQGEVECEIGKVLFQLEQFEAAKEYYIKSFQKLSNIKNQYYIIDVLIHRGILESHTDGDALKYFRNALSHAEEIKSNAKISILYKELSDYYSNLKDYKSALDYFEKYHYKQQELDAFNHSANLEIKKLEFEFNIKINEFENLKQFSKSLENEIAVSIEKLHNLKTINKKLKKEASIDELTGVLNRRGLDAKAKTLLKKFRNSKDHLVIFLIDIDHFKKYNDHWGHIQGDKCLIDICNYIDSIMLKNSLFGRYGGEEFLFISKVKTYDEAHIIGERIRKGVKELNIKYSKDINASIVTISIGGVYTKIPEFRNLYHLIEQADLELYKAKKSGRDKVCLISL